MLADLIITRQSWLLRLQDQLNCEVACALDLRLDINETEDENYCHIHITISCRGYFNLNWGIWEQLIPERLCGKASRHRWLVPCEERKEQLVCGNTATDGCVIRHHSAPWYMASIWNLYYEPFCYHDNRLCSFKNF